MFEEFEKGSHKAEQRRFGASMAVSIVLYSALGGGVVAASAAATKKIQEEDLMQVEFALPDEPEPPPPPPPQAEAPPPPKPKPKAAELAPPDEIPDEKLAESDGPLAEAPPAGPTDAPAAEPEPAPQPAVVAEAPPPPPPKAKGPSGPVQLPEDASPAELISKVDPAFPEEARKAGVHGDVIAKLVIGTDGSVKSVEILRGPDIFHAAVKEALSQWRFEPARLPDGTAISVFKLVKVPFKLENM